MLELPIYGVNLPFHFILAYVDHYDKSLSLFEEEAKERILFYINPFNKGAIFTEKEIMIYLNKINPNIDEEDIKPKYFLPCSKKEIIRVLLTHLKKSFDQLGYDEKINELNLLIDYLDQS